MPALDVSAGGIDSFFGPDWDAGLYEQSILRMRCDVKALELDNRSMGRCSGLRGFDPFRQQYQRVRQTRWLCGGGTHRG